MQLARAGGEAAGIGDGGGAGGHQPGDTGAPPPQVSRALTKLGLRDRAQLVVLAYESGLVSSGALGPDTHPVYTGQCAVT